MPRQTEEERARAKEAREAARLREARQIGMGKPAQDLAARQPKESNLSLNIWYKQRRSAVPTQAFVVPKTPWPGWQRTPTRNLRFLATSLIPIAKLVRLFSIVAQCTSFILDLTGPNPSSPSHQVTSTPPSRKVRRPRWLRLDGRSRST